MTVSDRSNGRWWPSGRLAVTVEWPCNFVTSNGPWLDEYESRARSFSEKILLSITSVAYVLHPGSCLPDQDYSSQINGCVYAIPNTKICIIHSHIMQSLTGFQKRERWASCASLASSGQLPLSNYYYIERARIYIGRIIRSIYHAWEHGANLSTTVFM